MRFLLGLAILCVATGCTHAPARLASTPPLYFKAEPHLQNIRLLAREGVDSEAYWSFDGRKLVFRHQGRGQECSQIASINSDGSELQLLSDGKGQTTSPFFLPSAREDRVLFSSTSAFDEKCPSPPDKSPGLVWPIYSTYQFFTIKTDGTDPLPFEPGAPKAYNSEAKVCHDGSIVFTSDRDRDLELYRGKLDRLGTLSEITRVTQMPGYDGGAFFSPDCQRIAWTASRPRTAELKKYQTLLTQHLVRPSELEIWTADADGTYAHQVTRMNATSLAPAFTPDGKRIIFASNAKAATSASSLRDPQDSGFDLYLIHTDGTQLERVTHSNLLGNAIESFPMFSPNGKEVVFTSSRNASAQNETHILIADWTEGSTLPIPLTLNDTDPANRFMAEVETLSADAMEGRGAGTGGLALAEDQVASMLKLIGVKPFSETYTFKGANGYKQKVEMTLNREHTIVATNNILGAWGKGCGKTPPVIVSAQLGTQGTQDTVSGIAGLLEVARVMISQPKTDPRACYIFAAFAGEESGITGSSRFTALLADLKIKPKAILNLDRIGRMENNRVTVLGSDSANEWQSLLDEKCDHARLTCDRNGSNDSLAFSGVKAPLLRFLTTPQPNDPRFPNAFDPLNATGGVQLAELVAAVALQASLPKQKFHYQTSSAAISTIPEAYLGAIPDYATPYSLQGGVRLAGVKVGSPAGKAGIQGGDVLTGIGDKKVETIEDYMNILVRLEPGADVVFHVRRKEAKMTLSATVGKRE